MVHGLPGPELILFVIDGYGHATLGERAFKFA